MRATTNVSLQSINSPLVTYQIPTVILSHQSFSLEFADFTSLANVLQLNTAHDRWKSSEKAADPRKPFINSMKCVARVYTSKA